MLRAATAVQSKLFSGCASFVPGVSQRSASRGQLRRVARLFTMALSTAAATAANSGAATERVHGMAPFSALRLVGQEDSVSIDQTLFKTFSVDSLMELAGLSVAEAVLKSFPPSDGAPPRILVAVGPGNNGGDGLVAARHLRHFGYNDIQLFYPKQSKKKLFQNLLEQSRVLGNKIISDPDFDPEDFDAQYDVVIDAVFGFSFKGTPREPFVKILKRMATCSTPVVSVDVPSGYVATLCVWFA